MQRGKALNRLLDFYVGVPALNLLASFHRRRPLFRDPRRIGLLFNPALGDTLLASSVTQEIRELFPSATLIIFAANTNENAARLLPDADQVKLLPITQPLKSVRLLRESKLDWLLDFTAWQRITATYSLLSGAHYTVGFSRARQYRGRAYDATVAHRGDCHELDNLRRLTASLGSKSAIAPRLSIPFGAIPPDILRIQRAVVFHPWASGALGSLREWPTESWLELALRLKTPERVYVLTGSPKDEARCDALYHLFRSRGLCAKILIGREDLCEIARVLTHAEMLVSVNTGIMHLGAILGVPTIALNGPTSVLRWGATGPRVQNLRPADGSGGFLDLGFEFRGHTENVMARISVDMVLQAVANLCGDTIGGTSPNLRIWLDAIVSRSERNRQKSVTEHEERVAQAR